MSLNPQNIRCWHSSTRLDPHLEFEMLRSPLRHIWDLFHWKSFILSHCYLGEKLSEKKRVSLFQKKVKEVFRYFICDFSWVIFYKKCMHASNCSVRWWGSVSFEAHVYMLVLITISWCTHYTIRSRKQSNTVKMILILTVKDCKNATVKNC